jgi:hypothetical protein
MSKIILYCLIGFSLIAYAKPPQKHNTAKRAAVKISAEKSDSININALIQKQIETARENEKKEKLRNAKKEIKAAVRTAAPAVINTENAQVKEEPFLSLNIILFIAGSCCILLYFLYRKYFVRGAKEKSELKRNIKLLREEKLIVKTKEVKNNPRVKLVSDTAQRSSKEMAVSRMAKEMNVSQGEILLAARIKSYEMAKVCSNKC